MLSYIIIMARRKHFLHRLHQLTTPDAVDCDVSLRLSYKPLYNVEDGVEIAYTSAYTVSRVIQRNKLLKPGTILFCVSLDLIRSVGRYLAAGAVTTYMYITCL